ncbi:nitroreductase [Carnobacterium divergens]|uniref:nitroreductase family protein n=1 Tax=Carnobacterium divergens TaxID=2748 RepID=UPI001072AB61|nr:nitroreductase family protein [Carnobacterium divergens]TFJ38638.1 nitroreductase [Carnobacterium divergens]TFJ47872.1 nitroreductase [Carnobacterium divergens]TFJ52836.1 nitroreductase [Carnobacterium divergens]TFJ58561.1 nitroreductase [Carnobacterium divergens]TFJ68626.1 nitroreductase [Carnobacterium divergens]
MSNQYTELLKNRRSIYGLGKNVSLSNDNIISLVKEAVKESPSSFNSQTSRVVVLFNESHDKLWDIVEAALRKEVPADAFEATANKLASFRAGKGTILYFEDMDIVKNLQEQFALYADNFPVWSEQASGIAQHSVWTALAVENIGASLQHYNPLIDDAVRAEFDLPASWNLRAQMPFGSIEQAAGEKEYMDDAARFRVFN